MATQIHAAERPRSGIIVASTLLGVGMGGFADGIVLHQILQWHSMLSSVVPPTTLDAMHHNMFFDGLFHAFTWVVTAVGIGLLWREGKKGEVPWSTSTFLGFLSVGWGGFNVVEGIVNHRILGIHHVRSGPDELTWDVGFLLFGAALVAVGWLLVRERGHERGPRTPRLLAR